MLFISVDFPDPETPVMQVNKPMGIIRSTFFKLLPEAPFSVINFFSLYLERLIGTDIFSLPLRNLPVNDSFDCSIVFILPSATMSPPCTPAPGPISMMWSALRIASSSCSTTITVLPRSRRWKSVLRRRLLSR